MSKKINRALALGLCLATVGTLAACSKPTITDSDNLKNLKQEHAQYAENEIGYKEMIASLNTSVANKELKIKELEDLIEEHVAKGTADAATIEALEAELESLKSESSFTFVYDGAKEMYLDELDDAINSAKLLNTTGEEVGKDIQMSSFVNDELQALDYRISYIPNDRAITGQTQAYILNLLVHSNVQMKTSKVITTENPYLYFSDINYNYVGNKDVILNEVSYIGGIQYTVYGSYDNVALEGTIEYNSDIDGWDLTEMTDHWAFKAHGKYSLKATHWNLMDETGTVYNTQVFTPIVTSVDNPDVATVLQSSISIDENSKISFAITSLSEEEQNFLKENYTSISFFGSPNESVDLEYANTYGGQSYNLSEEIPNYTFPISADEDGNYFCVILTDKEETQSFYKYKITSNREITLM